MSERPLMITGPFVLGEILQRNRGREIAKRLGIIFRRRKKIPAKPKPNES
jgi:hypothetical protein